MKYNNNCRVVLTLESSFNLILEMESLDKQPVPRKEKTETQNPAKPNYKEKII